MPRKKKDPKATATVQYPAAQETINPLDGVLIETAAREPLHLVYEDVAHGIWLYNDNCLAVIDAIYPFEEETMKPREVKLYGYPCSECCNEVWLMEAAEKFIYCPFCGETVNDLSCSTVLIVRIETEKAYESED